MKYKDYAMKFDVEKWNIAPEVNRRMDAIKYGREADLHGWLYEV